MKDNMNSFAANQNPFQQLSPELYNKLKPHIEEIAKELNKQELSDDDLNAVIDEITNSLLESDNMPLEEGLAIPTFNGIGPRAFRSNPYWNPYRRGWRNPRGLSTDNLIRLLLLRELGYLTF